MSSLNQIVTKIKGILSNDTTAVEKRMQIYFGLGLPPGDDFKRLDGEAKHDSAHFFQFMCLRYFGNEEEKFPERKQEMVEVLRSLYLGSCAEKIKVLTLSKVPSTKPKDVENSTGRSKVQQETSIVESKVNIQEPDGIWYVPGNPIGPTGAQHPRFEIEESDGFIGNALIVNILKFDGTSQPRKGAQHDTTKLTKLCRQLKLDYTIEKNLTREELDEEINNFIEKFEEKDHKKVCMVFILSHGKSNKDAFITKDEKEVLVNYDFLSKFNSVKLKEKPKIFVFGFCRSPHTVAPDSCAIDGDNGESQDSSKQRLRDMFLIHSTIPDRDAFRDPEEGTWFVDSFCRVFGNKANQGKEIKELMMLVDSDLEESKGDKQQCTYSPRGFNKNFYFK